MLGSVNGVYWVVVHRRRSSWPLWVVWCVGEWCVLCGASSSFFLAVVGWWGLVDGVYWVDMDIYR